MTNIDRETLRALADDGNEMAIDRLADLADQRGDLEELSDLLDEGCLRAGGLLTARAVTRGDLLELQRLSDAGCDEAGDELSRLLAAPAMPAHVAELVGKEADPGVSGDPAAVDRVLEVVACDP